MFKILETPISVYGASAALFLLARRFNHPMLPGPWTAAFSVFGAFWVLWMGWIYPTYFSPLRKVPTVSGFPLWGQFFPIISEECGVPQRRWHRKYGPVVRYYFPFGSERLSIASDAGIRHMTVKNPYNFPKPERAREWMVRILGRGVLLAEGAEHQYQRKTLNPGFSISAIRTFTDLFWEKGLKMAECQLKDMLKSGASVAHFEVLGWLNRCTLDIIGKAGFGADLGALDDGNNPLVCAYRTMFNFQPLAHAMFGFQAFFPSGQYIPCKINRDIESARKVIMTEAERILTEKLADAQEDAKDVLALIAQENKKLLAKGEPGLSHETMRDQIMTFLGAGHDTTATGVAWTVHLLATHPEIQEKLRREIADAMDFLFDPDFKFDANDPDKMSKFVDVERLKYLDNVCRESLRFIPPIPMTVRQSVEDDIIDGYAVPKDTVIYLLSNVINRLEWFWGETAEEFDPDRWNHLPPTAGTNAFMTFLQGPRGCLGRKFAEIEMKVLLCAMLSRWRFELDPEWLKKVGDPEDEKTWRLVLRPKYGVHVKAIPLHYNTYLRNPQPVKKTVRIVVPPQEDGAGAQDEQRAARAGWNFNVFTKLRPLAIAVRPLVRKSLKAGSGIQPIFRDPVPAVTNVATVNGFPDPFTVLSERHDAEWIDWVKGQGIFDKYGNEEMKEQWWWARDLRFTKSQDDVNSSRGQAGTSCKALPLDEDDYDDDDDAPELMTMIESGFGGELLDEVFGVEKEDAGESGSGDDESVSSYWTADDGDCDRGSDDGNGDDAGRVAGGGGGDPGDDDGDDSDDDSDNDDDSGYESDEENDAGDEDDESDGDEDDDEDEDEDDDFYEEEEEDDDDDDNDDGNGQYEAALHALHQFSHGPSFPEGTDLDQAWYQHEASLPTPPEPEEEVPIPENVNKDWEYFHQDHDLDSTPPQTPPNSEVDADEHLAHEEPLNLQEVDLALTWFQETIGMEVDLNSEHDEEDEDEPPSLPQQQEETPSKDSDDADTISLLSQVLEPSPVPEGTTESSEEEDSLSALLRTLNPPLYPEGTDLDEAWYRDQLGRERPPELTDGTTDSSQDEDSLSAVLQTLNPPLYPEGTDLDEAWYRDQLGREMPNGNQGEEDDDDDESDIIVFRGRNHRNNQSGQGSSLAGNSSSSQTPSRPNPQSRVFQPRPPELRPHVPGFRLRSNSHQPTLNRPIPLAAQLRSRAPTRTGAIRDPVALALNHAPLDLRGGNDNNKNTPAPNNQTPGENQGDQISLHDQVKARLLQAINRKRNTPAPNNQAPGGGNGNNNNNTPAPNNQTSGGNQGNQSSLHDQVKARLLQAINRNKNTPALNTQTVGGGNGTARAVNTGAPNRPIWQNHMYAWLHSKPFFGYEDLQTRQITGWLNRYNPYNRHPQTSSVSGLPVSTAGPSNVAAAGAGSSVQAGTIRFWSTDGTGSHTFLGEGENYSFVDDPYKLGSMDKYVPGTNMMVRWSLHWGEAPGIQDLPSKPYLVHQIPPLVRPFYRMRCSWTGPFDPNTTRDFGLWLAPGSRDIGRSAMSFYPFYVRRSVYLKRTGQSTSYERVPVRDRVVMTGEFCIGPVLPDQPLVPETPWLVYETTVQVFKEPPSERELLWVARQVMHEMQLTARVFLQVNKKERYLAPSQEKLWYRNPNEEKEPETSGKGKERAH
ncbi:hypothetical protein VTJ04DRAFT_3284 [Mycothermus thermophilus]|uniref:uncharacterized protein n=1 Tax=Humicola insolens TaxID=85995 RepID=UPI0037426071